MAAGGVNDELLIKYGETQNELEEAMTEWEKATEEEEEVKNLLTDRMKHAASLQVALEVEAQTGASWFDAK